MSVIYGTTQIFLALLGIIESTLYLLCEWPNSSNNSNLNHFKSLYPILMGVSCHVPPLVSGRLGHFEGSVAFFHCFLSSAILIQSETFPLVHLRIHSVSFTAPWKARTVSGIVVAKFLSIIRLLNLFSECIMYLKGGPLEKQLRLKGHPL